MKYFNSEEYVQLENLIKQEVSGSNEDTLEDLSALKSAIRSFAEYVYRVSEERIELRFAKGVLTGQEYRSVAGHFDSTRHTAHESAIVYTRMVNRIAELYDIGPIFLGNPDNRREVGEFCLEVTSWLFKNRYEG